MLFLVSLFSQNTHNSPQFKVSHHTQLRVKECWPSIQEISNFFCINFNGNFYLLHPGSAKFRELKRCVIKTVDICAGDVLPQSQIESIVHRSFQETTFCLKGGSSPVTSVGSPCRSSYNTDANNCLRTFHQTFAANKSDPELCS